MTEKGKNLFKWVNHVAVIERGKTCDNDPKKIVYRQRFAVPKSTFDFQTHKQITSYRYQRTFWLTKTEDSTPHCLCGYAILHQL